MVENQLATRVRIDYPRRLIYVLLQGQIDDSEAVGIYRRVPSLQEFRDGFAVLFDSTSIQKPLVTGLGQLRLANLSVNDTNLIGILVGCAATAGMAQLYQTCANWRDERVRVFTDENSAINWLTSRATVSKATA